MQRIEACPACGNSATAVAVAASESQRVRYLQYSARKYEGLLDDWLQDIELVILLCRRCGHHWYRDQPDNAQLLSMYEGARPLSGPRQKPNAGPTERMRHQMVRLKHVMRTDGRPKLLDYGSGFGKWAQAAGEAGFDVWAYEPSRKRAAVAHSSIRHVHDIQELDGRRFDAINLEQVLEHVPDPVHELKFLSSLCRPGGVVRIAVPNIERPPEGDAIWDDWPFDGIRAHTMAPFEHLHGFSTKSLGMVVRRAGLGVGGDWLCWRYYPVEQVRRLIGRRFRRLGMTFVLARRLQL